jgi:biopolymer transport protein ExbB
MVGTIYRIVAYYAESGGIINLLLCILFFTVVFLGTGKALQLRRNRRAATLWRRYGNGSQNGRTPAPDTFYGAMVAGGLSPAAEKCPGDDRNVLREILLKYIPQFDSGFDTIAACIAAAPLLGLLGTVGGMMKTFRIITEFGIGNPGQLSEGISMALITTQAGLVVVFPCLLFHNYLHNRKEELIKMVLADGEWVIARVNMGHSDV